MLAGPADAAAREIQTGAFVTSVSGLNPADGSFRLTLYLWFLDPEGRFDPSSELEVFARSSTTRVIVDKTLPTGGSYAAVEVNAVVDQIFDVSNYPFDRQSLRLIFETVDDRSELVFKPDSENSRVSDLVSIPGWHIEDLNVRAFDALYETTFGYRTERPTFSRFAVTIDVARNRSLLLVEKFTGFIVGFIIAVLSLAVPAKEFGVRLGMTTGSIFAAVFNRYRLEDAIGFDATFGLVDQISLLTFSAILSSLAATIFTHHLYLRKGPSAFARTRHWLGAGLVGFHLVLFLVVFAVALA